MTQSHGNSSRRTFLSNVGLGFAGLALDVMLHREGLGNLTAVVSADRPPALPAEGKERDLAVHERRRQPHGKLRPEADAQQVCRKDDRRNAVRRRAGSQEAGHRAAGRPRRQRQSAA